MYFKIILIGIAVFLLFRVLSHLKKILPFSHKIKHYASFILPVIELLSWLWFVLWCLHLIYRAEAYTTLIVFGVFIVLLFAPAWFLVRDFFFGLLLKIQRKIETDSKIEIGILKGVIVKADYFTFDIKTGDGNIKTIPYNKIRSEIVSKNAANNNLEKVAILFQIQSEHDIGQITAGLKSALINAPWAAATQDPIINIKHQVAGNYDIEAIVYVLKNEHTEKIRKYVKQNFIAELSH
ncbi:hypothetical protein MASR2M47_11830 [Draconibacterium sp.]|jgi:hypothetical protein